MKCPYLLIVMVLNTAFSQSAEEFGISAGLAYPLGDRSEAYSEGSTIRMWGPIELIEPGRFILGGEYSRFPGRSTSRYSYESAAVFSLSLGPRFSMPDTLVFSPAIIVNYDGTSVRGGIQIMSYFFLPFRLLDMEIIFNVAFDAANLVGKTEDEPSVYFIKLGIGTYFKGSWE